MLDQPSGDVHRGRDFSWRNAKTFWIIMIVAASFLVLHVFYKITKAISRHREVQALELGERQPRTEEETDHGLQEPPIALMRRNTHSSEVSTLPRYEKFKEDVKCEDDMEVEKRGKYSYAVTESWPRPKGTMNARVIVKQRYDGDAVSINDDALSPVYQRE